MARKIESYESNIIPSAEANSMRASGVSGWSGVQNLGEGISDLSQGIDDYQTRQQSGQISKGLTDLHVKYEGRLKGLQSPMSEEQMSQFMTEYDEDVSKIGENVSTGRANEYLQRSAAADKKSVSDSLISRNAKLLGIQQRENFVGTAKNLSTIVYNSPAPVTFQESVAKLYDASSAMSGENEGLRDQLFRENARELALSNFQGNMQTKGGAYAKGLLDSGLYDKYVDGTDKAALSKQADIYDRSKRAEAAEDRRLAREAAAAKKDATHGEWLGLYAKNQLSVDRVLNSDADPSLKEHFLSKIQKGLTEPGVRNPGLKAQLFDRINLPDSDPRKIWDIGQLDESARNLRKEDVAELAMLLDEGKSSQGGEWEMKKKAFAAAKSALVRPSTGLMEDQLGSKKYMEFVADYQQTFAREVEKGADPIELLDPHSPKNLQRRLINNHAKTPQELVTERLEASRRERADMILMSQRETPKFPGPNPSGTPAKPPKVPESPVAGGKPEPRKPGESVSQYRARIGR